MEMTTISSKEYRDLIEQAFNADYMEGEIDALRFENQAMQERLDKWKAVDMWFAVNGYYKKCFDEWAAENGLNEQAKEIARLQGENEELRRGMDELGAQVEYWRLKAGVDDE